MPKRTIDTIQPLNETRPAPLPFQWGTKKDGQFLDESRPIFAYYESATVFLGRHSEQNCRYLACRHSAR